MASWCEKLKKHLELLLKTTNSRVVVSIHCANTAYTAQAKFACSIKCGIQDDKPFCAFQVYLVAVILPPTRSAHAHAHM